ncbi:biotin--[acetyl-CoA-carboxylase] ligase [Companilactobacillus versmoldensis]|nr:biotin--[acetyl-CoA-carboxylase] ligase [Companilactobacillus versmoldensis]
MTNNPIDIEKIIQFYPKAEQLELRYFESIDSTNTFAKNHQAEFSDQRPTVLVANQQTNGYGRFKRDFYSPAGSGIYLTLVLPIEQKIIPGLWTLGTGVAVVKALQQFTNNQNIKLKWINDILLNDHKCGGILAESISDSAGKITKIVIGVGLNINTSIFPSELQNIAKSITEESEVDRNQIIALLLEQFFQLDFRTNSFLNDYRQFCDTLGKKIQVINGKQEIVGIADDILPDGSLVVFDDKKNRHVINSGEVSKIYFD